MFVGLMSYPESSTSYSEKTFVAIVPSNEHGPLLCQAVVAAVAVFLLQSVALSRCRQRFYQNFISFIGGNRCFYQLLG